METTFSAAEKINKNLKKFAEKNYFLKKIKFEI